MIGPYEVLSRLALGGMAELLLARRDGIEGFQKLVVLKRILPQYASNPEFVDMFLREARLAAALEHPNIVQVFDIGKSGEDYYFAMAYLHGKDALAILRELSRTNRRLPVEHAIAIASGIAAGLHHAHEQVGFDGKPLGIVHRDVSPANAIVTYDGTVKLVDFGIAKAAAQMNHTRAGVRKGKAAYMSPEQCRGDPLDRRTDIWSLGVVLYEMLTMTRLYRADNDLAIMHRIVSQDPPSPTAVFPDLSPALAAVVMRCMQRNRDDRYETAALLQRDLDVCAHELGMRPSAAALSEFLRGVFGTPALPWTPTDASARAPVTSSIDVDLESGGVGPFAPPSSESDSTRDLGHTPPPQVETRVAGRTAAYASASGSGAAHMPRYDIPTHGPVDEPSVGEQRSASAMWIVGGVVAAGLAGVLAWVLWPRADGGPARDAAAPAPAPQLAAPVDEPSAGDDVELWLASVNVDDATANPIAQRHERLAKLRATPAASRIDESLQVRLDLLQASGAARPCETFATALARAALDRTAFASVIATATPPDPRTTPSAGKPPDRPCDDLLARVDALRAPTPLQTSAAPPRPAPPVRPRKRPAATPDPVSAKPGPPPPPEPKATKLEDELRPFRK
jgi:serine/threonine protein kinase